MTVLSRLTDLFPPLKSTHYTILLTLLFCLSNSSFAQTKAFPKASGAGAYASGGRGKPTYIVTNLNNSGAGSFRQALKDTKNTDGGIITFEVSGTINLTSRIYFTNQDNITIAGQTAPAGGITVANYQLRFQNVNNLIMRYIRIRPAYSPYPSTENDAFEIFDCSNYIIDHCSFSWGTDEVVDSGNGSNYTWQRNLFAESNRTGMILGSLPELSENFSFNNNMFYNCSHRFPNWSSNGRVDIINNVIWNWKTRMSVPSGGFQVNHINNYYKHYTTDPAADTDVRGMLWYPNATNFPSIYTSGNFINAVLTDPNEDNWFIWRFRFNPSGTQYSGAGNESLLTQDFRAHFPFQQLGNSFNIKSAENALDDVKFDVGANARLLENGNIIEEIDMLDNIYLTNVQNDNLIQYTPESVLNSTHRMNYLNSVSSSPINVHPSSYDTDNDGMPNLWETQNGLNPNNSSDSPVLQADGYTNLEYFLNGMSIVGSTTTGCSNEVVLFPYFESFENSLGDWTNSSADDIDWTVDADGTPSPRTGPSSASNGAYYAFVEASGNEIGYPTKQALLNSPCFNLSGFSAANFSFKYHQHGSNDMGVIDLEASVDNGANWISIWVSTGDKGDSWLTANVDLGAYVGGRVTLRFNRVTGDTWEADIAIDEVSLSGVVNTGSNDCSGEITSFPYTEGFENSLGAWTQSSEDDMDWTVDADGTPSSGTGPSSASQGTHYVFVEASGSEIGYPTKQALLSSPCFNLSGLSDPNFSFKYHQYGSTDMGAIDLEASVDNGANWTSIWVSTGDKGDLWLTANVDLGAYVGGRVALRFNRVTGDTWEADIAIDEVVLSESGNSGSSGCSGGITSFPYTEGFENTLGAWTQSSADDMDWTVGIDGTPSVGTGPSSALQGKHYVFVEASGSEIGYPTKQALLNSPCFNLSGLSNPNFSFKYHQYGSTDMGAIDLEASADNGVNWTSIWVSTGDKGDFWLTANVDLEAYVGGSVTLRFNRVTGDTWEADIAIDEVVLSESGGPGSSSCSGEIASFPYTEYFENTLGTWTQSSTDDMDWTVDSDGTPSIGTGPARGFKGMYYVFVEASGNLTKQAILNSPCFDLSGQSSAEFSFNYHQFGASDMGTIDLEASNDNGVSWTSVWNSSGNLENIWLTAKIDLGAYIGSSVQLRFNRIIGGTWEADIAIDNINLSPSAISRKIETIVLDDIKDITLYPNPVKGDLLNIKSDYTDISFEIYNMVGQLVSKGHLKDRAINVSNLNGNIYQIKFSSEGEIITKRFIKQ